MFYQLVSGLFGFFNQNNMVYLIIKYKIIVKYINFNIISFKISITINNNSVYYIYILYKLYLIILNYIMQCYWFLSFKKKSSNKQSWPKDKYNFDRIYEILV